MKARDLIVLVLGVGGASCGSHPRPGASTGACPSFAACGGDPAGAWKLATACSDVPALPPVAAPCSGLLSFSGDAGQGVLGNLQLPHGAPLPATGQVTFDADHAYAVSLRYAENETVHFAPSCLAGGGASLTCSDLASKLDDAYVANLTYSGFMCATAADSGCDCSYLYESIGTDQGAWSVDAGTLLLASFFGAPTRGELCRGAADLDLKADVGTRLFFGGAPQAGENNAPSRMTLTPGP